MALSIKDQRPENIVIQSYPGAGHTLQGLKYVDAEATIIEFGGEEEENQKAKAESQTLILETLMFWIDYRSPFTLPRREISDCVN